MDFLNNENESITNYKRLEIVKRKLKTKNMI